MVNLSNHSGAQILHAHVKMVKAQPAQKKSTQSRKMQLLRLLVRADGHKSIVIPQKIPIYWKTKALA